MKSVFIISADDFVDAVIDTRYDVRVTGVNDSNIDAVSAKLNQLYGSRDFAPERGEIYIEGDNSLFKPRYGDGDLVHVIKRLTAEDGCPWDRAQTHKSIRINAVEEAYELCEAIDNDDAENVQEETGDLYLQAALHSDIAERAGEFSRLDVIDGLVRKLVTRHTHIFGDNKAANAEEALKHWEAAKAVEKHAESLEEQLARIPLAFPSLLRVQKTVKKLVKAGLVNDCGNTDAAGLLRAVCGCLKEGIDPEVELCRVLNKLTDDFRAGRIQKISDFEDKQ